MVKKSPNIWLFSGLASVIAMLPTEVLAEDAADDAIVVTARLDDPARDSAGNVRSLMADDLGAHAPVTLLDRLALIPGIDAFEKGGAGGGSYLALRGGEPNFTLVAINGVRVNDPMLSSGGGFDFTLIGSGDAARIDVLPGPLSTAYGADALAGVVSIRFEAPEDGSGAAARMGLGSRGRFEVGGRAFVNGRAGKLAIAASARDTGTLLAGAQNRAQSAMIAAAPRIAEGVALDLFGYYGNSDGTGFPEDSGGPELATMDGQETRARRQFALGANVRAELAADLAGQIRAGWSRSTLRSDSPGVAPGVLDGLPPILSDSRFERTETVASLEWSRSATLALAIGGSLVHEDGASDGVLDFGFPIPTTYALSRTLPGLFATMTAALPGDGELRAGVRADFPESGKARITSRAGVVMPITPSGLRLTASYAQGFKQPSLFALGFPLLANPDLLPERSRTIDAGLEWTSPDRAWTANATMYRSVYRDLIDFEPELFTNINRDRVTASGFELAASGRQGDFRFVSSLTYLDTRSADGAQLRFRPEWKGAAALEWRTSESLSFRLDGRFSSGFIDSSVPTGMLRMRGFATLDVEATIALRPGLELRATLRNLTDERYFRTIGAPKPGRNVFVSLHGSL